MTRIIRASSRQVVIPSVEDCSIVVWLLAGSYFTGVSTPEAGGVREETTRRERPIHAKRAGLHRPVTSSDKPKINLSGKPAGNGARIIRPAATKSALFLRHPSTQQ